MNDQINLGDNNININSNSNSNNDNSSNSNSNNLSMPIQKKQHGKLNLVLSIVAFCFSIVGIFVTNLIAENVDTNYVILVVVCGAIIIDLVNVVPIILYLKQEQTKTSTQKLFYFLNWAPLFISVTYALGCTFVAYFQLLYLVAPCIIIAKAFKPDKYARDEIDLVEDKNTGFLEAMKSFWIFSTCIGYGIWFASYIFISEWLFDLIEGGSGGIFIYEVIYFWGALPFYFISFVDGVKAVRKYSNSKEPKSKRRKKYNILNWITIITLLLVIGIILLGIYFSSIHN